AIVPKGVDNLLVPVALSASHVGFQTIRLEPTWVQLGEAAGIAAVESLERDTLPAKLDATVLQRRLAEAGTMLSFFADCDAEGESWTPAIQSLGTKGFFRGYEARPETPLDERTAMAWARTTAALLTENDAGDATDRARSLPVTIRGDTVSAQEFADIIRRAYERKAIGDISANDPSTAVAACGLSESETLSRGDACRVVYRLLAESDST
ncbi:MAG TPA: FAD-dependent oxidoreductase, partial [Halococcus sp.]|nr:FAD-dependent oxidoreductase [Halococcus sp.]